MRSAIKVYSHIWKHSSDISKFDQHYALLVHELYLKVLIVPDSASEMQELLIHTCAAKYEYNEYHE